MFQRLRKQYTHLRRFLSVILLTGLAPTESPAQNIKIHFSQTSREVIEARLRRFSYKNDRRESILKEIFEEAGCYGERIREQPVKHERLPNLICTLPGMTESTIIVGAHFDHSPQGYGVVDNWSGASLLPSFFQGLQTPPPKHTFMFIGFTDEEGGLKGSSFFANNLTPENVAKIRAMVNLDSLGLGPTKVWLSHSDNGLAGALQAVANALNLPLRAVNADKVGDEDSHVFMKRKIPTVMIHSVTQATFSILHSPQDDIFAINLAAYYDTYRLIAGYLALLDAKLD